MREQLFSRSRRIIKSGGSSEIDSFCGWQGALFAAAGLDWAIQAEQSE